MLHTEKWPTISTELKHFGNTCVDCRLDLPATSVCMLPMESRVVISVHGRTVLPLETGDNKEAEPQLKEEELAWAATQFYNFEG